MKQKNISEPEFAGCHPIVNVLYLVAVTGITMITMNPLLLLISYVMSFVNNAIFCGLKASLKGYFVEIPIFLFTAVIQPIFSRSGTTVLYYVNDNAVTLEAYIYGAATGVLLVSIIRWCSCIRVLLCGDKLMYLFGRFIPVLGLTFSMIMRFIPLLKQRYAQIHDAQLAMGRKLENVGLFGKMSMFTKEISILISWTLENSIETSASMEARGYGLKNRTSYHHYKLKSTDILAIIYIVIIFVVIAAGIICGYANMYYLPIVYFGGNVWANVALAILFVMLCGLPVLFAIKGAVKWHYLNSKM